MSNNQSMPQPFLRAILKDNYSKGISKFSVTQLLGPPQKTYLESKYEKKEKSIYNSYASLLGTAIHKILEENVSEEEGEIAEKRMFAEIDETIVSGQLDLWENKTIFDYKSTRSAPDEMKPEHYHQCIMNGYLAVLNGLEVERVAVVYINTGWSYYQSTYDPRYPKNPFTVFVKDYDEDLAKSLFHLKIKEHNDALNGKTRPCTKEEKWQRPTVYALMKSNAKKASKLCSSKKEAEEMKSKDQIIVERPGSRTFCELFCGFSQNCSQFKNESNQ